LKYDIELKVCKTTTHIINAASEVLAIRQRYQLQLQTNQEILVSGSSLWNSGDQEKRFS
jgi:hypothetical protein